MTKPPNLFLELWVWNSTFISIYNDSTQNSLRICKDSQTKWCLILLSITVVLERHLPRRDIKWTVGGCSKFARFRAVQWCCGSLVYCKILGHYMVQTRGNSVVIPQKKYCTLWSGLIKSFIQWLFIQLINLLTYFEFCNYSSEQRSFFCNRTYFLVGGKEQKTSTHVCQRAKNRMGKNKNDKKQEYMKVRKGWGN